MVIGMKYAAGDWPALEESLACYVPSYPSLPSIHVGTSEQIMTPHEEPYHHKSHRGYVTPRYTKVSLEANARRQMDCLMDLHFKVGDPAADAFRVQASNEKRYEKTGSMGYLELALINAAIVRDWLQFLDKWAKPSKAAADGKHEEMDHESSHEQGDVEVLELVAESMSAGTMSASRSGAFEPTQGKRPAQHTQEAGGELPKAKTVPTHQEQANKEVDEKEERRRRLEEAERLEKEEIQKRVARNAVRFTGIGSENPAPTTPIKTLAQILKEAADHRAKEKVEKQQNDAHAKTRQSRTQTEKQKSKVEAEAETRRREAEVEAKKQKIKAEAESEKPKVKKQAEKREMKAQAEKQNMKAKVGKQKAKANTPISKAGKHKFERKPMGRRSKGASDVEDEEEL